MKLYLLYHKKKGAATTKSADRLRILTVLSSPKAERAQIFNNLAKETSFTAKSRNRVFFGSLFGGDAASQKGEANAEEH